MRTKILHICKYYPPISGGIETVSKFIVDSLPECNHLIVSFNDKNKHEETGDETCKLIRAGVPFQIMHQPLSPGYSRSIQRAMKSFAPDIVYLHYPNPFAADIVLRYIDKKTPLVVHWHSDVVAQKRVYRFVKRLEKRLLTRAQRIIATSPVYAAGSEVLRPFHDKITVIPCAIDTAAFDVTEKDKQRIEDIKNSYRSKPIIFFVGRHVKYKGIEYLLQAAAYVKSDCVFLIGGSGELTSGLKKRYSDERIHWLGRIPDEQMKLYYHAADIFAFPSITKNEAFGVVLAESMYCRCPSVTFEIPCSGVNWVSPDMVTSLTVENSNAVAFANAIDTLLADNEMRIDMGEAARQRVIDNFSADIVAYEYRVLVNEIVGTPQNNTKR